MTLGPYAAFIVGAYAAVALVVAALIGWVVGDYVRQAARLRAFAARGVLRRSAPRPRMTAPADDSAPQGRRTWLALAPLVIFATLAALFWLRLGAGDPQKLPSALIGRPAPQTMLPPLDGLTRDGAAVPGLDPAVFLGKVSVVNVFASWCVPCHDEAPLLTALAKDTRFQLVGINYKDAPDNARRFLNRYGNPFKIVGVDGGGRAAIEWGVYGVPETFVVGRDGAIAAKLVGPVTADNVDSALKVAIEKALKAGTTN